MLQLFRKKQQFLAVSYATILHCLVDFCCIYLMMQLVFPACRLTSLSNWLLYTMLYNFIAFAGQLPVGIFGDWLQRNMNLIAVGLLFLLVAYCSALFGFPLLLIVLLLGIGNACFMLAVDVLQWNGKKMLVNQLVFSLQLEHLAYSEENGFLETA